MLNIFLTVDVEILGTSTKITNKDIKAYLEDIQHDIYGITPDGEFGLRFQINTLNNYGLKAVFFVDSLLARVVGHDAIREIVDVIQDGGHDVQLHIHTEWLKQTSDPILHGRNGQNIKDFTEEEQRSLIAQGYNILKMCGVKKICAFRAGNYGANFDTLRALSQNQFIYDTSYNACYLNSTCEIKTENLLIQPREINGIYEFPISFFKDKPNHYRHAQLCACSNWEMKNALMKAWKKNWASFVIVFHSSELVKKVKRQRNIHNLTLITPDRIVIKRFNKLCDFLAKNRDKFSTTTFSELSPNAIPDIIILQPLSSNMFLTAFRYIEQLARKIL